MPKSEAAFSAEKVVELLRREGLRITKKRLGILESLFEAKGPMTLQDIQASAGRLAGVTPDYATVFRMILLMEKLHLVHKVNLQRSCSYYELSDPRKHYDHLVCRECGEVVLIDIPCPIGDAETTIARQYGFRDLSHSLEFFGVCSNCPK
jgi:Fur family transcriptional regulator, ferric uptake regulator